MTRTVLTLTARLRRLCRPARFTGLAALAGMLFALLPVSASASVIFTCYLGYRTTAHPSLAAGHLARRCTFEALFRDPINPAAIVTRAFSCSVPTGTSGCTLTVDPTTTGVPTAYNLTGVDTAPLYSSTEESNGCVYSGFEHGSASLAGRYPLVFGGGNPPPSLTANPYAYGGVDPMPGLAYQVNGGDPMPAISASGGSLYSVVALHYFDCLALP